MASRQHAATIPAGEALTVIGQGINVHGKIHGEEDLRIEGRVEGSISLTETVHIAQSGVVVATIDARDVVVSGVVVGNVSATNSVSLEPGAKLVGDISTPRLIIADGAAFRGNVAMAEGGSPVAARARAATVTRTSTPRARTVSGTTGTARGGTTTTRTAARATPAARTAEKSAPRVAAVRPPQNPGRPDDEVTVVVRHTAIADHEDPGARAKKKAKKAPPRGRVPKPGKRKVNRR
ncbi:MAG: polymer-forming cytoskeletal protein [Nannocystaceae bacterium]